MVTENDKITKAQKAKNFADMYRKIYKRKRQIRNLSLVNFVRVDNSKNA